ncbi:MAG: DUF5667 domain-containing protein [bacterium]
MNTKKLLLLTFLVISVFLFAPKPSKAVDFQEIFTADDSFLVRLQEELQYFFAIKLENKVEVLEQHAEKRLTMAQGYAEAGNGEKVQNLLQNYLQIKEKQNNLLGKTAGGEVLGAVEERTIEQQKTMEQIKTKIDENGQGQVRQVQEQVVNQVAERIVVVNGSEGQNEFFQKVEHVWAPGTGPGGTAGVVYEGGSKLIFAPGTSAGGNAGSDIKTVEVKTGGGEETGLPPGVTAGDGDTAQNHYAPGTTGPADGSGVMDPGKIDK